MKKDGWMLAVAVIAFVCGVIFAVKMGVTANEEDARRGLLSIGDKAYWLIPAERPAGLAK